ncbi:hypothetical protein COO60DRAFT_715841 [Scenedesmus sp. NREL 46B-D3]|nr:hypothetical protein COO60DRAFT_715841 [Scenedesmus sp. NREL 46B-D3]
MDCVVQTRDQAVKGVVDALPDATATVTGLAEAQDSIQFNKTTQSSAASKAAVADAITNARNKAPRVSFRSNSLAPAAVCLRLLRPLAYIATALAGMLFIGSCRLLLSPQAFNQSHGLASSLSNWAPLPQGVLLALLLALAGVAYSLQEPAQGSSSSSSSQALGGLQVTAVSRLYSLLPYNCAS